MTASPCPFLFPGVRYRQVERSRQRHSAKHALNWSRCRRRFAVAETNDGGALTRGIHEHDVDSTRADESLANTGSLTSRGRFNASPNAVWRALTEYDSLHRVSEPVVTCKRLWISSRVGRAVLRLQSVDHEPLWGSMDGNFEVRIEEDRENGRITFESERADDKYGFAVKGKWTLRSVKEASYMCDVTLELNILPSRFPIITSSMRHWAEAQFPKIMTNVIMRAIELDQMRLRAPRFLPALETSFGKSMDQDARRRERNLILGGSPGYLGLSELPLPSNAVMRDSCTKFDASNASAEGSSAQMLQDPKEETAATGVSGNVYEKQSPGPSSQGGSENDIPAGQRWFVDNDVGLNSPGASEVHLRRFDTETTFHRRAIGAVRVEAPPELVYRILTDFDAMPEFIPSLAFVERVNPPFALRNRPDRVRLRQVFLKCHLYHCLESEVTMDVVTKEDKGEVQFRTLDSRSAGSILQGKWLVVPGQEGIHSPSTSDISETKRFNVGRQYKATVLKFAIEARALRRRTSRSFWQSSVSSSEAENPLPERAVFEEILAMLQSTRQHMELVFEAERMSNASNFSIHDSEAAFYKQRLLPQTWMTSQMNTLDSGSVVDPLHSIRLRLIDLGFGTNGHMPRRSELRAIEAYDVEQAIDNAGGFEAVAVRLGWVNNRRKPRGYWSDLANVEREVLLCIRDNMFEPGVMPSRPQFEELGRFDIARALARHGGTNALAEKIGLRAPRYRSRRRRSSS